MSKHKVLTRIRHDGDEYLPGEVIDLEKMDVKDLLAVRAIEDAQPEIQAKEQQKGDEA